LLPMTDTPPWINLVVNTKGHHAAPTQRLKTRSVLSLGSKSENLNPKS
jgi:hypothetical protein